MFKLLNIRILYWGESLKQIKNEVKEQKGGFLSILFTLGASLLKSMLAEKGIVRTGSGNKKGKRIVQAGYGNEKDS